MSSTGARESPKPPLRPGHGHRDPPAILAQQAHEALGPSTGVKASAGDPPGAF